MSKHQDEGVGIKLHQSTTVQNKFRFRIVFFHSEFSIPPSSTDIQ